MSLTPRERAPLVTDAIPPALHRRGLTARQTFVACLVGALVLAVFASRDTPGWAERLGDSSLDHRLTDIASAWNDAMGSLGFTRMHEALRAAMQRALDWQWHDDNR
jgi:hypothetical protein